MNEETPENVNEETPVEETPEEPQAESPGTDLPDAPQTPDAPESPDAPTEEPAPETGPDEVTPNVPEQPRQPQEQEEQPEAPAESSASPTPEGAPAAPAGEAEEAAVDGEAPATSAEKNADAIPGAELDPIALDDDTSRLSAEERAAREAEAEERAQREAAATAESAEDPVAAAAKPTALAKDARYHATGKRKNSVVRVIVKPGNGEIEVNGRKIEEYFPRPQLQTIAKQSLVATGYEGTVDVRVRAHGGGISGQAAAIRHGIAKALTEIDPNLRAELKKRGMLTRDSRVKERRKAGFKKARKRPQFSKR